MFRKFQVSLAVLAATVGLISQPAWAITPEEVVATIKNEAKAATPTFQGFSVARGERFYKQTHGNELSCASCHTDNPAESGKHAKTSKMIKPLAPAANAERFTDSGKVAKWFKRNCNDVLERACTPQEQGDVLAYLLTLKK
jgi:cytochrome c